MVLILKPDIFGVSIYQYQAKLVCFNPEYHYIRCTCPDNYKWSGIQPRIEDNHDYEVEELLNGYYSGDYRSKMFIFINESAESKFREIVEKYMEWKAYDETYNQPIRKYLLEQDKIAKSLYKNVNYYFNTYQSNWLEKPKI